MQGKKDKFVNIQYKGQGIEKFYLQVQLKNLIYNHKQMSVTKQDKIRL